MEHKNASNGMHDRGSGFSQRELLKLMGLSSTALALRGLAACAPAMPPSAATEGAASTMAMPDEGTLLNFPATAAEPYSGTEVSVLAVNSPQVVAFEHVVPDFEAATGIKVNLEKGGESEVLTKRTWS